MTSFSYEWDCNDKSQSPRLPIYGKNARKKIKKLTLYISLWDCLKNNPYVYTRHFHNWEIYVLFITHTFPNMDINDIGEDLTELLRELYIIHNNESVGINIPNTNEVLNAFLEKLNKI